MQFCDDCGHPRFPPAPLCPRCWSRRSTWKPASGGRATLRSAVVFHQLYHPAFAGALPYTVGLVDLDEGPSLYATLRGEDAATLAAGTRLHLEFETVADGVALPCFRREE
jgi:uncharacterized OB-fold protein